MAETPISLDFYDADDEVIHTYSRTRIMVQVLERAMDIMDRFGDLDKNELPEDGLNSIHQLVVDFYGEKFTIDELKKHADIREEFAVIEAIIARASAIMPNQANPTMPGTMRLKPQQPRTKSKGRS